jgi:hypothetical protein
MPLALTLASTGLKAAYSWLMNVVLERLVVLALVSWLAGWILGERARKNISDLWHGVFRFLITALSVVPRRVFRRSFQNHKDEEEPHH